MTFLQCGALWQGPGERGSLCLSQSVLPPCPLKVLPIPLSCHAFLKELSWEVTYPCSTQDRTLKVGSHHLAGLRCQIAPWFLHSGYLPCQLPLFSTSVQSLSSLGFQDTSGPPCFPGLKPETWGFAATLIDTLYHHSSPLGSGAGSSDPPRGSELGKVLEQLVL